MSIYASLPSIGLDDDEKPTGDVLTYRGSHVFPEPDDVPGAVFLASIPGHCVPGQDDDDFTRVGGFLRLDVMQNVDTVIDATVVLTVTGATLLRDQLTEWLGLPKRERTDRRDPTMTTDAREEAGRRYGLGDSSRTQRAFVAGAEWQASQPHPDTARADGSVLDPKDAETWYDHYRAQKARAEAAEAELAEAERDDANAGHAAVMERLEVMDRIVLRARADARAAEARIAEALAILADDAYSDAGRVRRVLRILSADAPTEPVQGDAKLQQNSGGWFVSSHGVAVAYVEPVTDRGAALIVDGTILPPNSASALREFFAADAPTVPAPVLERDPYEALVEGALRKEQS